MIGCKVSRGAAGEYPRGGGAGAYVATVAEIVLVHAQTTGCQTSGFWPTVPASMPPIIDGSKYVGRSTR